MLFRDLSEMKSGQPKSADPTVVLSGRSFGAKVDGACSSAVAVHAATRRWLQSSPGFDPTGSFFR